MKTLSIPEFYDAKSPNETLKAELFLPLAVGEKLTSEEKGRMHDLRNAIATGKEHFCCAFCNSPLQIYGDVRRRFHFEHLHQNTEDKSYEDCIYYSGYQPEPDEIKQMKYHGEPESLLHKRLKNLIDEKLSLKGKVTVEKIIRHPKNKHRWRKPDLRWETLENNVAIEVQVTTTSLNTIIGRADFYSELDMFILWIVDQLDESFTTYDIFADSNHNLFVMDEEAEHRSQGEQLWLKCYHYDYYIDHDDIPQVKSGLSYDWVTPEMLTFERKFLNGKRCNSIYYKSDKQLIFEARECKKLADAKIEEERRRAQEDRILRKTQLIEALKGCISEEKPIYILNEFTKSEFDNCIFLREFLSTCLRDEETITKHWRNFRLVYDYLVEHRWIQAWGMFDATEDNLVYLLPILSLPYIPSRLLFHIISKSYKNQFTYARGIKAVKSTILSALKGEIISPDILSRYCYVLACQRIIDKYEVEIYDEWTSYTDDLEEITTKEPTGRFCTSEQSIHLLNQLYDNTDFFLAIQSLMLNRNIRDNNPNLIGMANAIKIKKAYQPYFHLIREAFSAANCKKDVKLQHQMNEIHTIELKTTQNSDLDILIHTIFPTIIGAHNQM